jgi:glutathione synthase/RimK-type ligase-like ATP-grasp enzyme
MKPLQKESRIGVMSVVHEGRKPFGMQTYFFEDMVKSILDLQEYIFFFSPLDWDSKSNFVYGYKFIDSEWQESQEIIPNIIYDRSFSSDNHQKTRIDICRQYLRESHKTILNPFELAGLLNDKIDFHSFLIKNDIPSLQTYPFDAIKDANFFDSMESSRVYVKPTFGSKGKGIFVVEKNRDTFTLYDNLGKSLHFNTFNALLGDLMIEVLPEKYFIQEEAKIALFEDAPFDIRVLVQNYGNEYKVTGSAVRIGQKKSMTSNLNSGGRALPIGEMALFFEEKYNTQFDILQSDINKLCLDCTEILRNQFGEFCEIGFDILITKDKGPIIIEANAKPSRWVFVKIADYLDGLGKDGTYYHDRRKESVCVPMKYASYLISKKK